MRITEYQTKRVKEKSYNYNVNIDKSETIYNFCKEKLQLHELPHECFLVFALDTKNKVTGINYTSKGTLDCSIVHPRDIFSFLIASNAKSFIGVHNHPSGDTKPSSDDFAVTHRLAEAGELLDIQLLDHIIFTEDSYLSFKKEAYI